eukprot:8261952-Pyramimonas_sp.AAC.1
MVTKGKEKTVAEYRMQHIITTNALTSEYTYTKTLSVPPCSVPTVTHSLQQANKHVFRNLLGSAKKEAAGCV